MEKPPSYGFQQEFSPRKPMIEKELNDAMHYIPDETLGLKSGEVKPSKMLILGLRKIISLTVPAPSLSAVNNQKIFFGQ